MTLKKAIYHTKSPEETTYLGKKLAKKLMMGDSVLIDGNLGMGKTHLTKGIAEGLGITKKIKSPTYAYVNHYDWSGVNGQASDVYHYDLYRFNKEESTEIINRNLSSIGFWDSVENKKAINLIEWANRIPQKEIKHIKRRVVVKIFGENNDRYLEVKFHRPSILPESEIENYYEEWATPMHVRYHCKTVANVAMQLAQAYIKKGGIVNTELLYTACMLHDMNRVCDFKEIKRDRFFEEVSDEKWKKWLDLRVQFKGIHHSEIAYNILRERRLNETANVIRAHRSNYLVTEPEFFDSLEKKIIYYADKRAKHDEIVDVKERFRDGAERYKKFSTPEKQALFEKVKIATYKLEKELFKDLNIKPEDIK